MSKGTQDVQFCATFFYPGTNLSLIFLLSNFQIHFQAEMDFIQTHWQEYVEVSVWTTPTVSNPVRFPQTDELSVSWWTWLLHSYPWSVSEWADYYPVIVIETWLGSIKVRSLWPGAKKPLISKTSNDFQIPFKNIVYDQNENCNYVIATILPSGNVLHGGFKNQHSKRKIFFSVKLTYETFLSLNSSLQGITRILFSSAKGLSYACLDVCIVWTFHKYVASLLHAPIKRWYMALSSTVCCWITSKPCIGE